MHSDCESPFQFIENRISNLKITNKLIGGSVAGLQHDISNIDYKVLSIEETDSGYTGILDLSVGIRLKKGRKVLFSLDIDVEGMFVSGKEIDKPDFEKMLEINGAAVLFSIARSVVIAQSALCFMNGQVRLPMINMLMLYQKKHSKETDG